MMEAKDTVMDNSQACDAINRGMDRFLSEYADNPQFYGERDRKIYDSIAEAQAEISFKAGIKEVVGWIENNNVFLVHPDNRIHFLSHWQAKLKEWGIEG